MYSIVHCKTEREAFALLTIAREQFGIGMWDKQYGTYWERYKENSFYDLVWEQVGDINNKVLTGSNPIISFQEFQNNPELALRKKVFRNDLDGTVKLEKFKTQHKQENSAKKWVANLFQRKINRK